MSNEKKTNASTKKEFFLWRWIRRAFFPNKEMDIYTEEQLQSPFRVVVKNYFSKPIAVIALVLFILIALFVFIAPHFVTLDLGEQDSTLVSLAPGYDMMKYPDELLKNGVAIIYLEDFARQITLSTKLKGFKKHIIKAKPKNDANQTAVVLFTSGSEGLPKAVLLSHKNLQANRFQLLSILAVNSSDVFFNALPMFHSFGLSVCTVASTLSGVKTFFYPSPLHYRIVPELIYDTNSTIVCGTDTFFYGYARMGNPYDFFNLKYAIVGGEKLKERTADLFIKKFGVRILEGYGTTETSPVISLNTPMHLKEGTVGRMLPMMSFKLLDAPGIENGKILAVKGDNVMQGYMKPDHPLVLQAPQNGWYETGDIVQIDENGFITILGRLKRFAKIAGEMVSLTAIEEALKNLWPSFMHAALRIPDEKRGEQLFIYTTKPEPNIDDIKASFKAHGLSELWVPRKVKHIDEIILTGSGKFDYVKMEEMAKQEK